MDSIRRRRSREILIPGAARDGDKIVGLLRFYPKAVGAMAGAGGLCLQQDYPSGPTEDFANKDFPALPPIEDKTLAVHCLMTGCARQEENPFRRKGLGARMVQSLIRWAGVHGWGRIEAISFEDLPIIYEITGCAGHTFWEKLGFSVAGRAPHPDLQERSSFVEILLEQAKSCGIPLDRALDRIVMHLDLTEKTT